MNHRLYIIIFLLVLAHVPSGLSAAAADEVYPTFNPVFTYTTPQTKNDDPKTEELPYSDNPTAVTDVLNAPLQGHFTSNVSNDAGWNITYVWSIQVDTLTESTGNGYDSRLYREGSGSAYADMDYVFTEKGRYRIIFKAAYSKNGKDIYYFPENETDSAVFTFQMSNSILKFPNTFSPNGDGTNDYFRPKEYQSIVEFHAMVFNRWGKRLYSWDDVTADGWDGKIGGSYAKNGAYYFVCNAKGADGVSYHIKKTINIFTNKNPDYTDDSSSSDQ